MPRIYNSIVIGAPVDKVWGRIRDFYDMTWAPTLVESCVAVGDDPPTTVGTKRLINDAFLDRLITFSDKEYRVVYEMEDGPSPMSPTEISNYAGDLSLYPITDEGKTFAGWTASWDSTSTDGVDFMNPIYASLLKDLAAEFEK
jgi:zona occludens toxin (predicted ATPase)